MQEQKMEMILQIEYDPVRDVYYTFMTKDFLEEYEKIIKEALNKQNIEIKFVKTTKLEPVTVRS